jgi:hypothetical protein
MRIIVPQKANLQSSGASPTYIYSAWSVSTVTYAMGAVVRYAINGIFSDYQARLWHISNSFNAPTNALYWKNLGLSAAAGGYTYTTNVMLSAYPTWTSGQAVSVDTINVDYADKNEYVAATYIASGDNTIRPSLAVISPLENVATDWVLLQAANAWAPFDFLTSSRLIGRGSNNALVNPVTFTLTTTTTDTADVLFLAGMRNVKEITAAITYSSSLQETPNPTITPSSTHFGIMPTSAIMELEDSIPSGTAVTVDVTLDAYDAAVPIELGVISFGRQFLLANTEWGLESTLYSFSRKERNETYGSVKFIKRGSATQLAATCFFDPAVVSGDTILRLLANYDGEPIMLDFNNTDSDYDRLRVFGFFTNVSLSPMHLSWESLSMEVESLVA